MLFAFLLFYLFIYGNACFLSSFFSMLSAANCFFIAFLCKKKEKDYLLYPSSFYSFLVFCSFLPVFRSFFLFLLFFSLFDQEEKEKERERYMYVFILLFLILFLFPLFFLIAFLMAFLCAFFACFFAFFLYEKEIQKGKINSLCINLLRNLLFGVFESPSVGKNRSF